ncbi:MAG: hypothetical protein CSA49_02535 [Gammaproteobacteria bacterium]|nr:MAG: hypothetical protein CSA49_02535 [Gammaproteobacteria bacterium]
MRMLLAVLFIVISGCATGKELIESDISVNPDLELIFTEYRYSIAEINRCIQVPGLCLKNGTPVFGAVSYPPRTYLQGLKLRYKDTVYNLNTQNMYNADVKGVRTEKGVVEYFYASCYDKKNCIVRGIFSDAGGSYVAEWNIIDGVPIRTMLTSSADIVHKFLEDIKPPVYE